MRKRSITGQQARHLPDRQFQRLQLEEHMETNGRRILFDLFLLLGAATPPLVIARAPHALGIDSSPNPHLILAVYGASALIGLYGVVRSLKDYAAYCYFARIEKSTRDDDLPASMPSDKYDPIM